MRAPAHASLIAYLLYPMKNQYFGDLRDWLKYAMLRSVVAQGLSLTVGWMLTPDDGGSDGEVRGFLSDRRNEALDSELFVWIDGWSRRGGPRDVREIETSGLLGPSRFHPDVIEDASFARDAWFARLHEIAAGSDVVFLDPDNGFETASVKRGSKRSSKYVYWSEVASLWRRGVSIIVYQHLPRVSRAAFTEGVVAHALTHRLPAPLVLVTTGVDYFCFAQPQHGDPLCRAIQDVVSRSGGRLRSGESGVSEAAPDNLSRERVRRERSQGSRVGPTLLPGSENRNAQVVIGPSDAAPSLHGQRVYVLRCGACSHTYGANGCDVFQRRCPECQGGAPGIAV
jgi:hypothetical protein